jgi:hypothetical protein
MIALAVSTARDDKEASQMVSRVINCYAGDAANDVDTKTRL